jgi:signal peptidase II
MNGLSKLGAAAFALAAGVIALDQAVKYWVLHVVRLQTDQTLQLFGPFHLTGVWNQGVSFGLFRADHDLVRWALALFSVIVALVLASWVRRTQRPLFAVAVGLVMGGAIGNVIDRIRFGAVTDFIDISRLFYFPWVFNVADSAITIGIILLLLDMLRQEGQERAARGDAA